MSFRIVSPSKLKKNNTQLKFNPPIQNSYISPLSSFQISIHKNLYKTPKSFVVGNHIGTKIIPDLSGEFGWSVDIDKIGKYAVVGAPIYNSMIGFAKIYSIQNNTYTLLYTTSKNKLQII